MDSQPWQARQEECFGGAKARRVHATLTVSVVPDSGTGELQGLSGTMTIKAEGGKHTYGFSYSLP